MKSPLTADLRSDPEVAAFMQALDHPLKREIESVRRTILSVSPKIGEGIKWKAPSFRTSDYFATIHLRSTASLQVILHFGAKVKDGTKKVKITDPSKLLKWLATDRGLVTLGRGNVFDSNRAALRKIVDEWIEQV